MSKATNKGSNKANNKGSNKTSNKLATEAQIQAGIVELLSWLKLPFSVTDASRVWGKDGKPRASKVATGWPDITGCLPSGQFMAIEVKGSKGRLKPAQKETLERLRASGAAVLVAHSLEDAVHFLYIKGLPIGYYQGG
jgi:hypothetical protein